MTLFRIAARIAMVAEPPEGVSFHLGSHVYDYNINDSDLPDDLKQKFMGMLGAKDSFVYMYNVTLYDSEKLMDKLSFAQPDLLKKLSGLMDAVKPHLNGWLPKFDQAFAMLEKFEIPFDRELVWHVDVWVQHLHELVSALFVACGGDVPTSEVPPELLKLRPATGGTSDDSVMASLADHDSWTCLNTLTLS